MLADILPTGYEIGVLNGHVQPGDVVAIVGAGPIGLSAIMGARLFSPSHIISIDLADSRLDRPPPPTRWPCLRGLRPRS